MKEDKLVTVAFEIDTELYFLMLQACLDRRETIDEFVTKALQEVIKLSKTKKGRKQIVETLKKYKGV